MTSFSNFLLEATAPRYLFIAFWKDGKQEALKKQLKESLFVEWEDLAVVDGEIFVRNKHRLSDFEFVFVGTVGDHADLCSCVRAYLASTKQRCLFYGSSPEACNKILQSVQLKLKKLPQIKTIISKADKTSASALIRELNLPVISKIIHGSQGKGIKKHDTKESLAAHLEKYPADSFIFQEFIPNDGDYRVFFLKENQLYAIRRKSAKKSEFRNNTSLGGDKEVVELDSAARKLALQACKAMKFDVTGVDLIQHRESKEWFVMEINAAPQFGGKLFDPVIEALVGLIKGKN